MVQRFKEWFLMNKQLCSGCITFLFAWAASNAFADITMQQRMSVEAGG